MSGEVMMRSMIGLLGVLSMALLGASAPPLQAGPRYARILRAGPGGELDADRVRLASDDEGNTVVAGAFSGTLDLGGPTPLESTGGGKDLFAAAYDGAGQLLWQKRFGGEGDDSLSGLAVGGKGTIYLVGSLHAKDAADLGGLTPLCEPGISILALDPSGLPRWAASHHTDFDPAILGPVTADAEDNLIVIGHCEYCERVELGGEHLANAGNTFVAKIAPDGRALFLRPLGVSVDRDITGVAAAPDGALLISVTAKYMSGGDLAVRGAGAMDGFVVKLAPGGDLEWIRRFGGHEDDSADRIVVDGQGNGIITGSVQGTVLLGGPYVTDRRFWASLAADGRIDRVHLLQSLPRLAANRKGEVVLAGTFDQPIFLVTTLSREGAADAFIAWLDPKGEARLVRHLVGEGELRLLDLSVDARGQAVVAGAFTGALHLGGASSLDAGPSRAVVLAAFGGQ
jgi:hypothetical protein